MDSSSFSVVFTPTQTRYYLDSIVFSTDTESLIDPICVLQGEGIEPKIAIKGDNWGRRRIHLQNMIIIHIILIHLYPSPNNAIALENTGSVNISISSFELIEDCKAMLPSFRNGHF